MPGAGTTASLKTISGSIRGSRDPRAGTFRRSRRVVHRAIVNISPDRFVYVVFGPNRAIREPNLSSDGQLPAVSRIFLTTAVTRYASSRSKKESREENGRSDDRYRGWRTPR